MVVGLVTNIKHLVSYVSWPRTPETGGHNTCGSIADPLRKPAILANIYASRAEVVLFLMKTDLLNS
jgi:hypothetical protein